MRRALRLIGGIGLLGMSPLLVSLATFLSVPIILGVLGPEIWLAIAVGQAIGELSRVVVIWGWNSIGLTVVAAKTTPERVRYYLDSIAPRLILLVPVSAIAIVVSIFMPVVDQERTALMALVGAVYGMNAAWAFIGGREPLSYLLWDAAPRAGSILIASLALLVIPSAALYGWINLIGSVVAVGVPALIFVRRAKKLEVPIRWQPWSDVVASLIRGAPAFGSGFVMVLRLSFAVVAAPIISPVAGVAVALGDKFLRWSNTGMTPLMQALQVRIPRGSQPLPFRLRRGLVIAWIVGPAIGTVVAVTLPWASSLLSHGQIALGFDIAIPVGIAISLVFIAGITGNSALVLLGRVRSVFHGAVLALVVLSASFVPLTLTFGASGSFWALALSETTVTVYQFIVVRTALRTRRRQEESGRHPVVITSHPERQATS
jgi:hypothetical protein